jgi:hypothetical protein
LLSRRVWPAGHTKPLLGNDGARARAGASPFSFSFHRPVNGGAGDAEQVCELRGAVLATMKQSHQVRFLPLIECGLLTAQTPFGFGDLHPLPGPQPNQVGLDYVDNAGSASTPWPTGRPMSQSAHADVRQSQLVLDAGNRSPESAPALLKEFWRPDDECPPTVLLWPLVLVRRSHGAGPGCGAYI